MAGRKCPSCNSCMSINYIQGSRYFYCTLCKEAYRIERPSRMVKLEETNDDSKQIMSKLRITHGNKI